MWPPQRRPRGRRAAKAGRCERDENPSRSRFVLRISPRAQFRIRATRTFQVSWRRRWRRFERLLVVRPVLAKLIEAQNQGPGEKQHQANRRENHDQRAERARNVPLLQPVHHWIEKISHQNSDDQRNEHRRSPVTERNHNSGRDDARACRVGCGRSFDCDGFDWHAATISQARGERTRCAPAG